MTGLATNISIHMGSDLEAQANVLCQPNKETITAMQEAEKIANDPSVKGYDDLDELFAALKA